MARRYAVSIGINEYKFAGNLKYAKSDAQLFATFLKEEAKFDDVRRFLKELSSDSTEALMPYRTDMLRFFRREFDGPPFLSKDDDLWLFFSGHGIQHEGIDYILPIDGDMEDPENTAISLNWIAERLRQSGSEKIVLVVDACRVEGRKGPALESSSYNGITTIFSCKPNESSWEINDISQGAFTHVLLKTLKQQVRGNPLTIADTEELLQRELSAVNSQYSKPKQTPHIRCESATRANSLLFSKSLPEKVDPNRRDRLRTRKQQDNRRTSSNSIALKKGALEAEGRGELELAKGLWTQLLSIDASEHESYSKAISRITEASFLRSLRVTSQNGEDEPRGQSNLEGNDNQRVVKAVGNTAQFDSLSEAQNIEGIREYEYNFMTLGSTGEKPNVFHGVTYSLREEVLGIDMILIPEGSFLMGSSEKRPRSCELPKHKVHVKPFLMSKCPITKQQWKAIAHRPEINRMLKLRPVLKGSSNHPVVEISWNDAAEFCDRLAQASKNEYRLPTEAEWEYACRAGSKTLFHFGNRIDRKIAQFNSDKVNKVGQFPYANAFGLHDMHGNVWEWCMDHWHSTYDGAPTDGTAWLDSIDNENRIQRGGSWRNESKLCRSAFRLFDGAESKNNSTGFRIVRPL